MMLKNSLLFFEETNNVERQAVRIQLQDNVDTAYRQFSAALLPNIASKDILGVRLPVLRKMAQVIVKKDWRAYLDCGENQYFEEVMLQGMIIGYAQADIEEILCRVVAFLPEIDNWSTCDSFCNSLKCTKSNRERVWSFLQPYVLSQAEYEVRFAVVMLIDYYIEPDYLERVLALLDQIKHDAYYVKMAVAWAISVCYVKFPERTLPYLQKNKLDDFTYNKALQKITESLKIDLQTKMTIRGMKRR